MLSYAFFPACKVGITPRTGDLNTCAKLQTVAIGFPLFSKYRKYRAVWETKVQRYLFSRDSVPHECNCILDFVRDNLSMWKLPLRKY